jgi:hypothetical protein
MALAKRWYVTATAVVWKSAITPPWLRWDRQNYSFAGSGLRRRAYFASDLLADGVLPAPLRCAEAAVRAELDCLDCVLQVASI